MIQAVERELPDGILHLGDYWEDARELKMIYPDLPVEQVPGNCDWSPEAAERIITLEGCRVLFCHGHTLGVKLSLRDLVELGERRRADIALFGHTHRPYYERHGALRVLNPGSVGRGMPTYGVLRLEAGGIHPDIVSCADEKSIL